MPARDKRRARAEPKAGIGADGDMSAGLHSVGALPREAPPPAPLPREPGNAAFDRWLQRELARLYDQTLSEPVPEELLKLLKDTGKPKS